MKQPIQHWDTILIHLAKAKLDFNTQRDWEEENKSKPITEMPTLKSFLEFLEERSSVYELIEKNRKPDPQKILQGKKPDRKIMLVTTTASTTAQNCIICKQKHPFYLCKTFLDMSIEDRVNEVREKRACLNCLETGHYAQVCRASTRKKCSKPHNTLLHFERKYEETTSRNPAGERSQTTAVVTETGQEAEQEDEEEEETPAATVCSATQSKSQVMLATVQILVKDSQGKHRMCKARLDAGSQLNLITQDAVRRLRLRCEREKQVMSGISQAKLSAEQKTEINIRSMSSNLTATLKCQVLPVITERLPQFEIDRDSVEVSEGVQLADPAFWKPGSIDILIEASLFWTLMCNGQILQREGVPALQNTQLGWILGGEIVDTRARNSSPICLHITNADLHKQLGSFFEREEVPRRRRYTKQELWCAKQFEETTRQDETGRFTVTLPKNNDIVLSESMMQASKRLASMERKFKNQPKLREDYTEFMEDYERRGHMTPIAEEEDTAGETYVIPHQSVEKPDSLTTELRVVFDASCKTTTGFSLNDKLLPGPNLQGDLFDIITRFRTHRYVMTADVEKMYRHILVDEKDRDLQRILWRSDSTQPVKIYRLNTVSYGTSSATYLAMGCLRALAYIGYEKLPLAARVLDEDFFMDDCLTGTESIEDAILLQKQLMELLGMGKFPLRKWRANDGRILDSLDTSTDEFLVLPEKGAQKTLGQLWNAKADTLNYNVNISEEEQNTKREVLSKIAQIYDPLGLAGQVVINAKIIIQELWRIDSSWDETLPAELQRRWSTFYDKLPRINDKIIRRNVNSGNSTDKIQLFGFGDASEKAYGACVYAVS